MAICRGFYDDTFSSVRDKEWKRHHSSGFDSRYVTFHAFSRAIKHESGPPSRHWYPVRIRRGLLGASFSVRACETNEHVQSTKTSIKGRHPVKDRIGYQITGSFSKKGTPSSDCTDIQPQGMQDFSREYDRRSVVFRKRGCGARSRIHACLPMLLSFVRCCL